jgi:DNA-directed RNA polymerase
MKGINGSLTDERSLILGRGNDVGQNINTSFLDKINAIPYSLDLEMVELLSDEVKAPDEPITWYEQKERDKAFNQLVQETNTTIDYLLENGNKFWFTWKYDKRGRSYSQGYHINPQGNSYRKAILNFAEEEKLTKTGVKWLKIDIANNYGYDKCTWFQRILEADKMLRDIFSDLRSWKRKAREYSDKADNKNLFLKAVYAYHKGVIKEEPIGHMVGLDATA